MHFYPGIDPGGLTVLRFRELRSNVSKIVRYMRGDENLEMEFSARDSDQEFALMTAYPFPGGYKAPPAPIPALPPIKHG